MIRKSKSSQSLKFFCCAREQMWGLVRKASAYHLSYIYSSHLILVRSVNMALLDLRVTCKGERSCRFRVGSICPRLKLEFSSCGLPYLLCVRYVSTTSLFIKLPLKKCLVGFPSLWIRVILFLLP